MSCFNLFYSLRGNFHWKTRILQIHTNSICELPSLVATFFTSSREDSNLATINACKAFYIQFKVLFALNVELSSSLSVQHCCIMGNESKYFIHVKLKLSSTKLQFKTNFNCFLLLQILLFMWNIFHFEHKVTC